ncbi:tetratricopeptide repeat-containing sulfotransferase family protein [Arenimonas daejeonensis]|uniref:tetratricopeptide repeat-containing sulfotransferase family protein n=1 Tax=Arenimonas daejeonensis TaxID=370777 RepID=UPI0011BF9C97|nr:tetratricopeptide repeat-containing sulfotransferase family protein [Arenimonas daejeonensis]
MNTPPPTTDARLAAGLAEARRLQRLGNAAAAGLQLQRLRTEFPGSVAVHKALASLNAQAGQAQAAVADMQAALAIEPGSAQLHCELGCLLAHYGRFGEALGHLRTTTTLQPAWPDGWYFLGITLVRLNLGPQALAPLRRAFELAPGQTRNLQALARAEFSSGHPVDALPLWRELARRQPDDVDTILKLGESLGRVGEHDQARDLFAEAASRQPESADLWMALAQSEEDRGDRDAAEAAYEHALERRPGWVYPLAGLFGLRRGQASETRVEQAIELQASSALNDADRALLGYELGKVHDGRGDFRRAMASWDDANAARERVVGRFDLESLQAQVEHSLRVFDAALFAHVGDPDGSDERPVFVVGMPRSGTTLTEQILGAHGQAMGCGELPDMALIVRSLAPAGGPSQVWPHIPEHVDLDALPAARARYLEAATRHAPASTRRLVDKSPMNYYLLGQAALMFPRARIVWCRRDPRDIAISIYGENFSLDERFATRLDGIGHCINLQERLMRHWQQVLPNPILEFDYQALVSDVETQARRLVDFVGLPWDPACLQFHASGRGVQTPSRWQVRQPVHTRSVGRWRNYTFALAPLLAVLDSPPQPAD